MGSLFYCRNPGLIKKGKVKNQKTRHPSVVAGEWVWRSRGCSAAVRLDRKWGLVPEPESEFDRVRESMAVDPEGRPSDRDSRLK